MKPLVSIIMGSTSDLPVMEKACKWLEQQEIPFEVNALSAHRELIPDVIASQSSEILPLKATIATIAITTSTPTKIAYSVVPCPDSSSFKSRRYLKN